MIRATPLSSGHGMTLIEMTVALTLLSILSIGILTAFRVGGRAYQQLAKTAAEDRDRLAAQRFLRNVLESAYPFEPAANSRTSSFGLEGTATDLTVTAPMPQGSGSSGYYRYRLTLEDSADGLRSLVVRWSLDRNGAPPELGAATADTTHREVLIAAVDSLEWAYLEPSDPDSLAADVDAGNTRWRSTWTNRRELPALVRLRLSFARGDARRWPELIVAPRITADARCQFDLVSQTCRESSG